MARPNPKPKAGQRTHVSLPLDMDRLQELVYNLPIRVAAYEPLG